MSYHPNVWDYNNLKELFAHESLPAMLVHLEAFDANVQRMAAVARSANKTIRLASKSIRVPALIQRVFEVGGSVYKGIMCFSVEEAYFLSTLSLDDFLVAYPTVQLSDLQVLWELTQRGTQVTLMVDSLEHVKSLEGFWSSRAGGSDATPLSVCIDVDMSYKPMGLHLGVRRSPVRSLRTFQRLFQHVQQARYLELNGVMGYEAQIAGLVDNSPFSPILNPFKRALKHLSAKDVARQRSAIHRYLTEQNVTLRVFNGGGTGSIYTTATEPYLTEVTVGSGFLQGHLFDYYKNNENYPAFCFGLCVSRVPCLGMATCQSGGFVASGEVGADKAPIPFLPRGLRATQSEGFGEVQTPLYLPKGVELKPGDPVFFRPAKSGEIAERFEEYLLLENHTILDRVPTYRGFGKCFY